MSKNLTFKHIFKDGQSIIMQVILDNPSRVDFIVDKPVDCNLHEAEYLVWRSFVNRAALDECSLEQLGFLANAGPLRLKQK